MTTIRDIRGKALERILLYCLHGFYPYNTPANNLHSYLYLSWICRDWRESVIKILFNEAHMYIFSATSTSTQSAVKSNIKLIVENGLSKYVQKLDIEYHYRAGDTYILVDLLDGQLFTNASWPAIYHLRISGGKYSSPNSAIQGDTLTDPFNDISDYFHTHLPAITHISTVFQDAFYTECPLSLLINRRLHQITHLHSNSLQINFTPHSFSSSLTYLALNLGPQQTTIPHIYAPTLRSLALRHIPPGFSFRCFFSESKDSFDFSELESMMLNFSPVKSDSPMAISINHGDMPLPIHITRKLHVPKLKDLFLFNIPLSYTHLFTRFVLYHLGVLHISGSFQVLKQMSLCFPYCSSISFTLSDGSIEDTQGYNTFTNSLFCIPSIATECTFKVKHYYLLSVTTIAWANMRELNILSYVSPISIYRLVSQLPSLRNLSIGSITIDEHSSHSLEVRNILEQGLQTCLQKFSLLFTNNSWGLTVDCAVIYELLINIKSLKEMVLQGYDEQQIKKFFCQQNIQNYPHLQGIHIHLRDGWFTPTIR